MAEAPWKASQLLSSRAVCEGDFEKVNKATPLTELLLCWKIHFSSNMLSCNGFGVYLLIFVRTRD